MDRVFLARILRERWKPRSSTNKKVCRMCIGERQTEHPEAQEHAAVHFLLLNKEENNSKISGFARSRGELDSVH